MTTVVALSGGNDSTAMALRLLEVEPELDPIYLITPTGDELPAMGAHWILCEELLCKPLTRVTTHTLASLEDRRQLALIDEEKCRVCSM